MCSVSCGTGFKIRTRTCDNPLPKHGGQYCTGSGLESFNCSQNCDGMFIYFNTFLYLDCKCNVALVV